MSNNSSFDDELPRTIVITGPTSSGKSDIAIEYALLQNGEIISADSRQVYRGLDIGTGKISKNEMRGVRHHLLDIREPLSPYHIVDFQHDAKNLIQKIDGEGKLPIVCGGSSQWISALVEQTQFPPVTENLKRREELEELPLEELCALLTTLDPRRAGSIDQQNKRRVIRAIEIAEQLGSVPSSPAGRLQQSVEVYVLCPPREVLRHKIYVRLIQRFHHGMIEESEHLLKTGQLTHERMEQLGLEYRWISRYLRGEITQDDLTDRLFYEIWHYAKRQITWWKKKDSVQWIDPTNHDIIQSFIQSGRLV